MNAEQCAKLRDYSASPARLYLSDLSNVEQDRTLLFGATVTDTYHVYLKGGQIHIAVYREDGGVRLANVGDHVKVADIPSGLSTPAACDEQFCKRIIDKGYLLHFAPFQEREQKVFHGKTHEELLQKS